MTQQQKDQEQLKLFVVYTAKNGARIPEKVMISPSKNEAIKQAAQEFGIAEVVDGAVAPVEDLVRYILPTMMMTLMGLQQMLAVVAQLANEIAAERALRKNVGLVRPS